MVNVRKAITCQSEVDIGKVKICNQFVVWNSRRRKFWLFNFLYLLHLGIVELHHIFLGFTVLLPILSSLPSVIFFIHLFYCGALNLIASLYLLYHLFIFISFYFFFYCNFLYSLFSFSIFLSFCLFFCFIIVTFF